MFIKMLAELKEKFPQKYTKIYPPKNTFSCLKQLPYSVLSPIRQHAPSPKEK
jgi:hypothetical protein